MNKSTVRADKRQILVRGKGYLRRSAVSSPALGIRENTRMTVTVREALFTEPILRENYKRTRDGTAVFFCCPRLFSKRRDDKSQKAQS